ncbi:MAG: hypothetical protein RML14_12230 [Meiothermus sp.]|uniref:hypothetical protein n=1 Tax=Meiothermus sp. TaxID=1955249 RepID=UPI00298F1CDF|nr:hypothetical protein [Meiothermus sp.]MDW8482603.1 hypothetical protein [Meiothermus sp.]
MRGAAYVLLGGLSLGLLETNRAAFVQERPSGPQGLEPRYPRGHFLWFAGSQRGFFLEVRRLMVEIALKSTGKVLGAHLTHAPGGKNGA